MIRWRARLLAFVLGRLAFVVRGLAFVVMTLLVVIMLTMVRRLVVVMLTVVRRLVVPVVGRTVPWRRRRLVHVRRRLGPLLIHLSPLQLPAFHRRCTQGEDNGSQRQRCCCSQSDRLHGSHGDENAQSAESRPLLNVTSFLLKWAREDDEGEGSCIEVDDH
jgi:hypothetical protein